MNTIFIAVPIGCRFECNGNEYTKTSSRTARLEENNRVFYFGIKERVSILGKKG